MIRAAISTDSRSIAEIHVMSWQRTYVGQIPAEVLHNLSVSDREAGWSKTLATDHDNIVIAEEGGETRGFVHFGTVRDAHTASTQTGEVYSLYLHPESQGRGLGRDLWSHAINTLRARGYADVVVCVLETNQVARRFYERCGCVLNGAPQEVTMGGTALVQVPYILRMR